MFFEPRSAPMNTDDLGVICLTTESTKVTEGVLLILCFSFSVPPCAPWFKNAGGMSAGTADATCYE